MLLLKEMKTYAHLKPGQRGTLRLQQQYGNALLCVRYRYDEARGMKIKTVEIIVEEKPLLHSRFKSDDYVPVSVGYHEKELRELLRKCRARWEPEQKVWYVRYELIRRTPLEARVAAR
jgi:hypothetical protein